VFEEQGPIAKPFVDMFGLRAKGGINKPSYYAFELLHELGNERLTNSSRDVIATESNDGTIEVAAWNLVDPGESGREKTIELDFTHTAANARVTIERLDEDHGNVLKQYAAMGSPLDPTPKQVEQLNQSTALGPPAEEHLSDGKVSLHLAPDSLVLVKVLP
jgi:xylan 1,4-beta-xylosidase